MTRHARALIHSAAALSLHDRALRAAQAGDTLHALALRAAGESLHWLAGGDVASKRTAAKSARAYLRAARREREMAHV
jgi:hypothetical protein